MFSLLETSSVKEETGFNEDDLEEVYRKNFTQMKQS